MFKKFIVALAALIAATAFAAVDANKATQAELESIKGIGPVISTLIINERKKGDFKDWNDMVVRVKGVGDKSAEKFSEGGLTVNGATFTGAPMKAPVSAKAASAVKGAASAVKATASKAASAVKSGASTVATNAKEEKDALKENVKEAKEKHAEKKAEKAEKKAAAASAATK
jgi:competence protein ComEA